MVILVVIKELVCDLLSFPPLCSNICTPLSQVKTNVFLLLFSVIFYFTFARVRSCKKLPLTLEFICSANSNAESKTIPRFVLFFWGFFCAQGSTKDDSEPSFPHRVLVDRAGPKRTTSVFSACGIKMFWDIQSLTSWKRSNRGCDDRGLWHFSARSLNYLHPLNSSLVH